MMEKSAFYKLNFVESKINLIRHLISDEICS